MLFIDFLRLMAAFRCCVYAALVADAEAVCRDRGVVSVIATMIMAARSFQSQYFSSCVMGVSAHGAVDSVAYLILSIQCEGKLHPVVA